ncbi:Cullin-domain-containing protein [Rhodofomes roseus]|uniref:Cullin-domain-containing protein n=1 Tax=Rhodofomes roseus TaxID=34475 RepID=A0ABQ8KFT6_9APHY|nr:Cullin-domain-containing protein [Rhodofomes roseus]KAH9836648.1 Cullin-domain-containing protein [Rhodofomes roseus]
MTDVFTLLSLPKTSKAFNALPAVGASEREGSASPLHKVPRLDRDSDSASASRSRAGAADAGGRITIKISGTPIKPPTVTGRPGDKDFALVTRSVRALLDKQNKDGLPVAYEYIYRACRSAVDVYNRGEGLYENVKLELEKCVGSLAKELLQNTAGKVEWLLDFNEICAWFDKQTAILQSVLTYLDRVYLVRKKDSPSIKRLVFNLFAERIFENSSIVERLHAGIKAWLEWERKDRTAHKLRQHIPALVRHLSNHRQYTPIFEDFVLDITKTYYEAESTERTEALRGDARDFLKHCEARCREEDQRAKAVLPESSLHEILKTTDKALLTGRLDWLAKDALGRLMNDKAAQKLGIMYRLFARVEGQKVLCAAFKLHVQNTVKDIVKNQERDEEMVQRLLDFKAFCDRLCTEAFVDIVKEGPRDTSKPAAAPAKRGSSSTSTEPITMKVPNKDFSYAVIDAFALGFKARRNKPAEMIAKYLDRAMRKGQKGKRDEEFQAELDAALGLYRFTDDKDVFRTFYHRALAKRLLLERSASDDFEKAMLKRLKEEYDPEFSMGDHMFNDLALSRDLMREYNEQRTRLGYGEAMQKLSVMVLQRSFWPFAARKHDVDLPPTMQDELTKYMTFYKSKHSGRKLDWDHALGTATIKARFTNGGKELSVSLYQGIVLLLFNESTELSFKEIQEQTRMDDAELRRTLQSLALGKKRVLRKAPMGKEVDDDDVFHFNADFTDPRYQVHINSIQVKETAEENRRTQTAIEGDRKHALDAAIVRVMKARKELHYEQLKAATIDAVKDHFVPEVSVIKQRIASLVEQEYLRRDEDDMNLYIYVA